MDKPKTTITLCISHKLTTGQNIYVVGNIPELGNWNLERALLLKNQNDETWENSLEIDKGESNIEYKYVIQDPANDKATTEDGENRVIELSEFEKPDRKKTVEKWNLREVCILIKYDCPDKESLGICGDGDSFGNWKDPTQMEQVNKKDPLTGKKTSFWQIRFYVKSDVQQLNYRFVLMDKEKGKNTWEREPNRICDLHSLSTKIDPSDHDHEAFQNTKDRSKFVRRQNRYIKYDCNFVSKFVFNAITDDIFVGPYPQNQTEIGELQEAGIRAVLNLQTIDDMHHRSLNWDLMQGYYKDVNLKVVNFQILDLNAEAIYEKAFEAATVLKELIENYGKVFVHCTAGMGRAPHTVAIYLICYQGYGIDDAIKLIKEKRRIANLNRDNISRICEKYGGKVKKGN